MSDNTQVPGQSMITEPTAEILQQAQSSSSSETATPMLDNSSHILIPTPTSNIQTNVQPEMVMVPNTAAIYFMFVDDEAAEDKHLVPNKLVLARPSPTVSDLCNTLKALFFPLQDVVLTATFGGEYVYPENSPVPVPVNDRNNVVAVSVKHRYSDSVLKLLNPQTLQTLQWLQSNNLDTPELLNLFQQHRMTLDNLKFLSDNDLLALGIQDWGTRIAILEAVNKFYAHMLPNLMLDVQNTLIRQNVVDQQLAMQLSEQKRKVGFSAPSRGSNSSMSSMGTNYQHLNTASILGSLSSNNNGGSYGNSSNSVNNNSNGSASASMLALHEGLAGLNGISAGDINGGSVGGSKKRMIRFKDLDFLTNEPLIPVDVGRTTVQCIGSNTKGTVVLNKQRKPVIEYSVKGGKKKPATIAQFYKATTGQPLQAKGDSWSKIFFCSQQHSGPLIQALQAPPHTPLTCFSLEDIKFIMKGPRKAVSAFLYFSKEIRGSLPKGDTEFAKKSGDMWKTLGNDQRSKYKILEEEDKKRYQVEKARWMQISSHLQQDRGIEHLELPWKLEGDDGEDDDDDMDDGDDGQDAQ